MKAVVAAFNQDKVLVDAFSVIVNFKLRKGSFPALVVSPASASGSRRVKEAVTHILGSAQSAIMPNIRDISSSKQGTHTTHPGTLVIFRYLGTILLFPGLCRYHHI